MSRDAIEDLVHRYADAVVHRDGVQWESTWAPDAVWELGQDRRMEGREAIVEFWHTAMGGFDAVIQTVLNGTAELDESAGTGTGRWYVSEQFQRTNGDAGILSAHYDDEYKVVAGEWLFTNRGLVVHYMGPPDLSGTFFNTGFNTGPVTGQD
ncbi:MAG: hypothetical protein ACI91O_001016 [Candidatus Poriferisodalaceae bacterium]|jgi:hypothetical protein